MSDEVDVSLHGGADEPRRAATASAPAPASEPPEIYVAASVIDEIDVHVSSDTTVEQGGVIVGFFDERTRRVVISGSIRAEGAVSKVASLTFTHETWDHISTVQERDYPGTQMVGWYHSHPHFGVFLSDHDLFIHRNFFSQPWQVAYVVDPLLHQRGFFGWDGPEIARYQSWHVTQGNQSADALAVDEPARGNEPPPLPPTTPRSTIAGLVIVGLLVGAITGFTLGSAGDSSSKASTLEGSAQHLNLIESRQAEKGAKGLEAATDDHVQAAPVAEASGTAYALLIDQDGTKWKRSNGTITNDTKHWTCELGAPATIFGIGSESTGQAWIVWTLAEGGQLASYRMLKSDGECVRMLNKMDRSVDTFSTYGDYAWAVSGHDLYRVGLADDVGVIQVFDESGVSSVAAGPSGAWALRASGRDDQLDYIDNSTGTPIPTWTMPVSPEARLSTDATGVWVSRDSDERLAHVSADNSTRVSDTIVGPNALIAATPSGQVWVADDGKLRRYGWSACTLERTGSCELEHRSS